MEWIQKKKNMAEKYTKDKLINELLIHNQAVAKYMAHIADALQSINDSNTLHANAINSNTTEIKNMIKVNSSFLDFVRWILIVLVLAIIVLAGAEKVLDFLPPA